MPVSRDNRCWIGDIFKKTGLRPVSFGETIIGPNLPNLNYMLAFKDMVDRDQRWQVFRDSPDWKSSAPTRRIQTWSRTSRT